MNNFKLKYKSIGKSPAVTNWLDERTARTWFDQLSNDCGCAWCELICNDGSEDVIMDEFVQ